MAVDYAAITRACGGALYLMVGLFLVLRPPRSKALVLWGAGYALTGALLIYNNWLHIVAPGQSLTTSALVVLALGDVARAAVLLALAGLIWGGLPKHSRLASATVALAGIAVLIAWAFVLGPLPEAGVLEQVLSLVQFHAPSFLAVFAGFLWITLLEALRTRTMVQARTWLLAAFPLVGGLIAAEFAWSVDLLFPDLVVFASELPARAWLHAMLVIGPGVSLGWCFVLLGGPHGRLVRNLMLGWFAWVVVWLLYATTAPDFGGLLGTLPGPVRVLALSTVAYAILAGHFLPTPLRRPTARRGALAGVALASLIVAAQVAQNFLGDEYGTFVGGGVAGVVLVAAFPLQRRLERAAAARGRGDEVAEESFRRAAALAMRDHVLSRQEELDLLDLAFRLRIPPGRAAALIDGERAGAKAAVPRPTGGARSQA